MENSYRGSFYIGYLIHIWYSKTHKKWDNVSYYTNEGKELTDVTLLTPRQARDAGICQVFIWSLSLLSLDHHHKQDHCWSHHNNHFWHCYQGLSLYQLSKTWQFMITQGFHDVMIDNHNHPAWSQYRWEESCMPNALMSSFVKLRLVTSSSSSSSSYCKPSNYSECQSSSAN